MFNGLKVFVLYEKGIGTNVSYRTPICSMPAYAGLGFSKEDFPNCEKFCQNNISLPIFDYFPTELANKVIHVINKMN